MTKLDAIRARLARQHAKPPFYQDGFSVKDVAWLVETVDALRNTLSETIVYSNICAEDHHSCYCKKSAMVQARALARLEAPDAQ